MANRPVEYTSRHRLWNVDVGFRITEAIFTLRVNGKDFYELEEANKSEEKEEKVYRIGTRSDEQGIVKTFYFDMRIQKIDQTCVLSYDPRTCILKCTFDKYEQTWTIEDLDDEGVWPIHFYHQKFQISVTISYEVGVERFKLFVEKKAFELLPYWIPNQSKSNISICHFPLHY